MPLLPWKQSWQERSPWLVQKLHLLLFPYQILKHFCPVLRLKLFGLNLQQMANWGRCPLTYQSGPGCQVLPTSLHPYLLQGTLAGIPCPFPQNSPTQRLGCLFASCPSLYNPTILVNWRCRCRLPFSLLASCLLSHPLPDSSLGSASRPLRTLTDISIPGYAFIYNQTSPPPYLGAPVFFPFSFLFFFVHLMPKPGTSYDLNPFLFLCFSLIIWNLLCYPLTAIICTKPFYNSEITCWLQPT